MVHFLNFVHQFGTFLNFWYQQFFIRTGPKNHGKYKKQRPYFSQGLRNKDRENPKKRDRLKFYSVSYKVILSLFTNLPSMKLLVDEAQKANM